MPMTATRRRMADLVETVVEHDAWARTGIETLANAACGATFGLLELDPAGFGVVVLACDDARIAALNAAFRDSARPTNVLSWPSQDRAAPRPGTRPARPRPGPAGDPAHLGDIAIAWETCLREAEEAGRPLRDHVLHLLVHGCLHLLGYDHQREADAALMEGLETRILASLGVPDPY